MFTGRTKTADTALRSMIQRGKIAAESEAAYFYDDNALREAKKIADGLADGAEQ